MRIRKRKSKRIKQLLSQKEAEECAATVRGWVQEAAKEAERATGITFEQYANHFNQHRVSVEPKEVKAMDGNSLGKAMGDAMVTMIVIAAVVGAVIGGIIVGLVVWLW